MQQDADSAVQQLLTGDDVNPAEVLTSLQKADLSFRMVMQIRNKLLQAYQEIKDVRI
jgi:flagellar hook-basal body complex protein FliE